MKQYEDYLALLEEISSTLSKLTETAQQKSAAVRQDDLAALNETLKQEQALALALRGHEQKRGPMLTALGFRDASLPALPEQYPPDLRLSAKKTVETLQRQYRLYNSAAQVARNLLETNLHQIEKILADAENPTGPGYVPQTPPVQPPSSLRSDFRV